MKKRPTLFSTLVICLTLAGIGTQGPYGAGMYRDDLTGLKAPEISGGQWLNTTPANLAGLKGKVVLIDFWDYTCVNCLRTLPYLKEWHDRYGKYGLTIIGVHAPEFEFARDEENVRRAVDELGIKYPVVLDNDFNIWKAYRNQYWPRKILIDQSGMVKFDHAGEGRYTALEVEIRELIKAQRPNNKLNLPELMEPVRITDIDGSVCYPTTPELYAGFLRGILGNEEGYHKSATFDYKKDPGNYSNGKIYLRGKWFADHESLRHDGTTPTLSDYIGIKYHAVEVNAVLKTAAAAGDGEQQQQPVKVFIMQDGKPLDEENKDSDVIIDAESRSYVLVTTPKMYNLVKNHEFGSHVLHLFTRSDGLSLHAFTFGTCLMRSWMLRR